MSNHTPGPWEAHDDWNYPFVSAPSPSGRSPVTVAQCPHPVDAMHRHQRKANARLIAAAPDLLVACRKALGAARLDEWGGAGSVRYEAWAALESAIAKATEAPQ